jgi:creatinine amidohydrolase/Fe(II)-dependent formamide hydrolase-like protein
MSAAVDERGYPSSTNLWMDWSNSPLKLMPWWSSFSHTGVQGDATKGTAEKGAELFEAAVSEVAAFVDELKAQPIPRRRDRHGAQG